MLDREVMSWAKMYYFTSIGLNAPNVLTTQEEFILSAYRNNFLKPVSKFLTGDESQEISKDEIASFMTNIKTIKIYGAFHLLNYLVENNYLAHSDNAAEAMKNCSKEFRKSAVECYGVVIGGKPFKCFRNSDGDILGTYHTPVMLLGDSKHFPNGLDLDILVKKSPISLNDYAIKALRNAVYGGIVEESSLVVEKFMVPTGSDFEEKYVTAMTKELPHYFVRQLITLLPNSLIVEKGNPYVAALEYAEEHESEYKLALKELRRIFSKMNYKIEKSIELTDDIVLKYISDKYGASVEDLREKLMIPTVKKLYTSPYLLDANSENMSAQEFMAYAAENPMAVSGTLDEIVEAFCKDENFDKDNTVEDLLKFINDEPIAKKDLKEDLLKFVVDNDIPIDMSLEDFIEGKTETPSANDKAVLTLEQTKLFDGLFIRVIKKVLLEGKVVEYPTTESLISRMNVPDNLRESLLKSSKTGSPVELPETEIDKAKVVDFLIKKGIPRVQASAIADGEFQYEDKILEFLQTLGLPEDEANEVIKSRQLNGQQILKYTLTEDLRKELYEDLSSKFSKTTYDLDDAAFKAGLSLLYNMRNTIVNNDSSEFRMGAIPIIESFTRLMMVSKGDEEDAAEFLGRRKDECSGDAIAFIEEAVKIFKDK